MNVDLNNIDNLFLDSLENIEVKPSAKVKEKIKKRMFYHNLMKNIYLQLSVVAISTAILTSLIWFYTTNGYNNIAEIINTKVEQNVSVKQLNNAEAKNTIQKTNSIKNNNKLVELDVKNDNRNILNSENITKRTNNKSEEVLINDNIETEKTTNEILNENIKKVSNNNITNGNKNEKNISHVTKQQEELNISVLSNKSEIKNEAHPKKGLISYKSNISNDNKNNSDNNIIINSNNTNTINPVNNSINKFKEKSIANDGKIILLKYKNSVLLNQQVEELNKLQIPDDTVGYNINNEPIVMSSNRWYVDLNFSPNLSNSNFLYNSAEYTDLTYKLNDETSSKVGYNIGINAGYKFKNFSVNLGVAYSEFNQKINAKYNEQQLINIDYFEHTTSTDWQLDTTFYWNLDSLMQGDSVLTPIIDSTQIVLVDSNLQTRVDTSQKEISVLKTNKYKYIEFPLTVEYVFNRGKKLSPFINGGLITGLLIKTSTYTYQANNGALIQDNNTPYIKPNFWLAFGAGIRYNINNKYGLMVYPYYRYNLKSIIESSNIYGQKINVWGVNFGVRYTF